MNNPLTNLFKEISPAVSDLNPVENLSTKDRQEVQGVIAKVLSFLVPGLVLIVPLVIWPMGADWFELPKNSLFFVGSALAFILWLASSVLSKKAVLARSVLDLPIFALALVSVISGALSINYTASLLSDPMTLVGGALLFFTISQLATSKEWWNRVAMALVGAGAILGLITIVQYAVVVFAQMTQTTIPFIYASPLISLAGSPLAQAVFIVAILPLAIGMALRSKGESAVNFLTPIGMAVVVMVVGLALSVFTLYQSNPALLDLQTGWRVATGSLDSLKHTLVGVSPAHYVDAFTAKHPAEFNASPLWNSRFATSSNFYLYVLTTLGILGLAALLWVVIRYGMIAKKRMETGVTTPLEKGLLASVGIVFVLFLLLPAPIVLQVAAFALLGLLVSYYRSVEVTKIAWQNENSVLGTTGKTGLLLVSIAGFLLAGYYIVLSLLGDYYMGQSLEAARANRGSDTYTLQIQAVTTVPWNDTYRVAYSQTNLALADSLAAQPNLTDEQRQTIVQLVQQAIREARIAVTLEPNRAANLENLSFIYRNLINFAEGADQWALLAQNQAIILDPVQPRLRLDLGGLYFALGDYQSAAQVFAQAVNLKPNYANAHYNLAQALKNLNLNQEALAQLQLAGALVCSPSTDNDDCRRVNQEITDLGSQPASPAAVTTTPAVVEDEPLASPAGQNTNLPNVQTQPPARISSPSGEVTQ